MKFIGSKSNKIGSYFIRKFTGSKSSHFLLVFDEALVVHSTLTSGVGLDWFSKWRSHNEIVWEINLPLPLPLEEEVYQSTLNENADKGYDILGFIYWGYALLKSWLLKKPLPSKNAWSSNRYLLCTGLYANLPEWLVGKIDERELEMTTPDKLGEIIEERVKIISEELCP